MKLPEESGQVLIKTKNRPFWHIALYDVWHGFFWCGIQISEQVTGWKLPDWRK